MSLICSRMTDDVIKYYVYLADKDTQYLNIDNLIHHTCITFNVPVPFLQLKYTATKVNSVPEQ